MNNLKRFDKAGYCSLNSEASASEISCIDNP
nr:MAG TPA: hypothetical protein [Bacteriophage sp.]